MVHILIKHKVRDYSAWKIAFDAFIDHRIVGGEKSFQIFHQADEPNDLVILFEWDNAENAHTFLSGPQLREAMKEAGVLEAPEIYFLDQVAQGQTG